MQKKILFQTKKANLAAFDLLFAFVLLISILLPILNTTHYTTQLQNNQLKNSQKLSLLLQISEEFYTVLAAKKEFFFLDKYSQPAILSEKFNPRKNYDYTHLGIKNFSTSLLPPTIISNNQICVRRIMFDKNHDVKSIWFCTW